VERHPTPSRHDLRGGDATEAAVEEGCAIREGLERRDVDSPANERVSRTLNYDKLSVTVDLPHRLRPMKTELALWRAFLADEIEAILRD
jgi:hypothetical protein